MKKALCLILLPLVLLLSACNKPGYTQTPETEQALETYYSAVRESVAQTGGSIDISIHLKDTVVAKKDSTERYQYIYSVNENKENFDYRCFDDKDKLTAHFATADGDVINKLTGEKATNFAAYQNHNSNPISTLKLFRMDANYKVQDNTISSITMEETQDATLITVTFHGDKLTNLAIKSEGGLQRTVTSHTRTYTIRDGKISKIEIADRESAQYQNESGTMDTDTVVEIKYYDTSSNF